MSHSKGFSFIEIILVLAISSVVILIFVQNINLSQKFSNTNPQSIFVEDDKHIFGRGLYATSHFVFANLPDSLGKRNCSIDTLEEFSNTSIPPYQGLDDGEVVAMYLLGDTLLAGMDSATSSDPDLIILDTKNWNVVSRLNTGPGIAGMALQGHYLYLANTSVNSQFQVVDISNISAPYLLASLKIPGSLSSNPKLNPKATSISSNITNEGKSRIFLGTEKSDLGEIFVADFNGSSFSFVNSYYAGSIVNDVFADGSGLWATSPSDDELYHYNASGTKDYVFNANGQSGNGKRIDMLGQDFKILGRTFGHEELVQIDGPSQRVGGSIKDLLINMDSNGKIQVLILASIKGEAVLQVWDSVDAKLNKLIKSIILEVQSNRLACGENSVFIGTASSTLPFIIFTP